MTRESMINGGTEFFVQRTRLSLIYMGWGGSHEGARTQYVIRVPSECITTI